MHGFYMDGARFNREEGVMDDQLPVSEYQISQDLWRDLV